MKIPNYNSISFNQHSSINDLKAKKTPPNSSESWSTAAKVGLVVAGLITTFTAGYLITPYFQPQTEPPIKPIIKKAEILYPSAQLKNTITNQTLLKKINETPSKEIIQNPETSFLTDISSYTANLVYELGTNILSIRLRPEGPFSGTMKIGVAAIVLFLAKSPILPASLSPLQDYLL